MRAVKSNEEVIKVLDTVLASLNEGIEKHYKECGDDWEPDQLEDFERVGQVLIYLRGLK